MRITQHSARGHSEKSAFGTRHNDRNNIGDALNIDKEKSKENITWQYTDDLPNPNNIKYTFESSELKFYEDNFKELLDDINHNYIKNRHPEKVTTMEEWKKQIRHAPEEVIIQLGKIGDRPDPETTILVISDYIEMLRKFNETHNNPFTILNYAYHQDELGAPHLHLRRVWHYKNEKKGRLEIGQEKALKAAGVELPYPDKKESKYNNRKVTFDKMMRENLIAITKEYDLEVETTPLPKNMVGKTLEETIVRNERERQKKEKEVNDKEKTLNIKSVNLDKEYEETLGMKQDLENRKKCIEDKETELAIMMSIPPGDTIGIQNELDYEFPEMYKIDDTNFERKSKKELIEICNKLTDSLVYSMIPYEKQVKEKLKKLVEQNKLLQFENKNLRKRKDLRKISLGVLYEEYHIKNKKLSIEQIENFVKGYEVYCTVKDDMKNSDKPFSVGHYVIHSISLEDIKLLRKFLEEEYSNINTMSKYEVIKLCAKDLSIETKEKAITKEIRKEEYFKLYVSNLNYCSINELIEKNNDVNTELNVMFMKKLFRNPVRNLMKQENKSENMLKITEASLPYMKGPSHKNCEIAIMFLKQIKNSEFDYSNIQNINWLYKYLKDENKNTSPLMNEIISTCKYYWDNYDQENRDVIRLKLKQKEINKRIKELETNRNNDFIKQNNNVYKNTHENDNEQGYSR